MRWTSGSVADRFTRSMFNRIDAGSKESSMRSAALDTFDVMTPHLAGRHDPHSSPCTLSSVTPPSGTNWLPSLSVACEPTCFLNSGGLPDHC